MAKFKISDLRIVDGVDGLRPDNEATKVFFESLPNDYKFKREQGKEVKQFDSLFFPEQELPEILQSLILIDKMVETLHTKSNVPKEFINDLSNNEHEYDESIALLMRFYLDDLRDHEKKGPSPNYLNMLTRSEIAYVAYTMLLNYISNENMELFYLIRSLLGIDLLEKSITETNTRKDNAITLKLLYPEWSIRTISKKLNVNPSTVSRWLKELPDDLDETSAKEKIHDFMHRIVMYWEVHKECTTEEIAHRFHIEVELIEALRKSSFYEAAANLFNSKNREE